MVLNLAAERNTPIGESFTPPSPILHVLSSDGHLCSFSCVNTTPGAPNLCTPAPGLTQDGRRPGTVQFAQPPVPTPASVPPPAILPPPPYSQPILDNSQVQLSSDIFNPNSASFIQSTPVKPFGTKEPSAATTTAGTPFGSLFKPAEGSPFGGASSPFGGGASSPFSGFGKSKDLVPSPLSKISSKEPTPPRIESTPAPVKSTPVEHPAKPVPPAQPPTSKRIVPDETAKRRLDRKIDDEFRTFEEKLAALRDSVSNLKIDIGTQVSFKTREGWDGETIPLDL